jgi:hypothetical protein
MRTNIDNHQIDGRRSYDPPIGSEELILGVGGDHCLFL